MVHIIFKDLDTGLYKVKSVSGNTVKDVPDLLPTESYDQMVAKIKSTGKYKKPSVSYGGVWLNESVEFKADYRLPG